LTMVLELSHVTDGGLARMVDVSMKQPGQRVARAEASVILGEGLAELVAAWGGVGKGPVLEVARLAGIQAAKRTAELIPLCHPIAIDHVDVTAKLEGETVRIETTVRSAGRTGVEMEALTAAAVAALTVYDMVKAAGREVEIQGLRLIEKSGGKSGHWRRSEAPR